MHQGQNRCLLAEKPGSRQLVPLDVLRAGRRVRTWRTCRATAAFSLPALRGNGGTRARLELGKDQSTQGHPETRQPRQALQAPCAMRPRPRPAPGHDSQGRGHVTHPGGRYFCVNTSRNWDNLPTNQYCWLSLKHQGSCSRGSSSLGGAVDWRRPRPWGLGCALTRPLWAQGPPALVPPAVLPGWRQQGQREGVSVSGCFLGLDCFVDISSLSIFTEADSRE